jgi:A/G-specific adenine glycosylase
MNKPRDEAPFSRAVLDWFARHGRNDLPWQQARTPYRVWVSEIMLQQTRVATVIPYYRRFMERFPDVAALAAAGIDQVLHHWSGLGYYARARHLHAAAQEVVSRHGGVFPGDLEALQALPGIGRSTAGAILALATGQRHPILDGNVKRVLARYHAVAGWPGSSAVQQRLWELADRHTPATRVDEYTQAIMDLGATVCTRTHPDCVHCPVQAGCAARRAGRTADFPGARPARSLPVRQVTMLMLRNAAQEVLLVRRPPAGIWGGLWGFPECTADAALEDWARQTLGVVPRVLEHWPVLRHTFSHFHLDITPVLARAGGRPRRVMETDGWVWYNVHQAGELGFAAPVRQLLTRLATGNHP